jgi:F0F1-type ATP synthase membrane subunit c/vacuolar-type H+-ATPase subunit K
MWDFNWKILIGAGLGMALASVATSIVAGVPEYKEGKK